MCFSRITTANIDNDIPLERAVDTMAAAQHQTTRNTASKGASLGVVPLSLCMPLTFANSCGYMFGVHDDDSRVIRSIMLHTLRETSTSVQGKIVVIVSSLIYSLTSQPVACLVAVSHRNNASVHWTMACSPR
ncbi:hypothetical protein EDC04DRAFT_1847658 [Pisolithus marmoratus]|nr:hypothetical protein EDC04DRAFT_1847658 [Pisolithus marmoratus]